MYKKVLLATVGATFALNVGAAALAAPPDATTYEMTTQDGDTVTVVEHDNLGGPGAPRSHDTRAEVTIYHVDGSRTYHQVHIQCGK